MKKNTTLYESMVNELFKMLDEVNSNDTKQSKDKCHEACHHGVCDCEHCHDENEDNYEPNFEVLEYTDEDFKDTKKVEDYVNELSKLAVAFESMPETQQAIVKILFNNTDVVDYINDLIEHAYYVHDVSIMERAEQKRKEEAEKKQNASSSQIKELVRRYIDEEVVKTLSIGGITLPKSKRTALETSYTDFANWILKQ